MRQLMIGLTLALAGCGGVPLVGQTSPQAQGDLERRIATAWATVEAQTTASKSVANEEARARRMVVMQELIDQLGDAQKRLYTGALQGDPNARAEATAIMQDVERVISQLDALDAGR